MDLKNGFVRSYDLIFSSVIVSMYEKTLREIREMFIKIHDCN